MDAVQDLAARAAAYMGVIQQLCVEYPEFFSEDSQPFTLLKNEPEISELLHAKAHINEKFKERALQLIWINSTKVAGGYASKGEEVASMFAGLLRRVLNLISQWGNLYALCSKEEFSTYRWTSIDFNKEVPEASRENLRIQDIALPSPNQWRDYFSSILYSNPEQRLKLSEEMCYMPSQVILAVIATPPSPLELQVLQKWGMGQSALLILVDDPGQSVVKLNEFEKGLVQSYLKNQLQLCEEENAKKNALPFELVFKTELSEISKNRKARRKELKLVDNNDPVNELDYHDVFDSPITLNDSDPMLLSKKMQLNALAFSGGGIRSATFNLGVLQALAEGKHLSKFDYTSTVSGGGYIGSWLVAWIKREGSMLKVCDRLNRQKSGDPMAEEVRPVRWLRMYSNYLTPTTGIMSIDSWTVGMTLLRNMFLNQLIIFLLLMTTLVFGKLAFLGWENHLTGTPTAWVLAISSLFIFSTAILAGVGMQSYHAREPYGSNKIVVFNKKNLNIYLLLVGYATSIIISAWMSHKPFPAFGRSLQDFTNSIFSYWPPLVITFIALLIVAYLGRYDVCIPKHTSTKGFSATMDKKFGVLLIVVFSALAALIGFIALLLAWNIITSLGQLSSKYALSHNFCNYPQALTFVLGPPLILEALSITIVMRMALLGIYFPDERREWWGRIGGHVHRTSFIWILVVGAALVGNTIAHDLLPDNGTDQLIKAAGGWAVIVFGAVKAAFSPKSEGNGKQGLISTILSFVAKAGPYLFVLGLLFFLPVLLSNILEKYFSADKNEIPFLFIITVILASITTLLAWRVGVNEFSMHHFYKNRLVRAYLGGTRSRTERKETSSTFTGFDNLDDVLLSTLVHKDKFHGPYPIINAALNASKAADLDRQDRKAESFIFSPLYCGYDFSPTRPITNDGEKSFDYGYRPTEFYAYPKGLHLGSAMSISGAAANPNQGFHSSPATAFLLTAFNVRLGWWIGNPRKDSWTSADPKFGLPYLISNLIGKSNTSDDYISLSDGGHFDNTGLYEMIRRRVSFIVLGDAELDEQFTCESLANVIRRCWIDFGVEIDIDVTNITNRKNRFSKSSFAVGRVIYPGNVPWFGVLIYLKSSVTEDQAVDIREYALKNPSFPHQTTGDQFFDESQFESYRKLGYSIAMKAFADPIIGSMFNRL